MPLIQPERRRTGSPALAMSGMASAIAVKISSISSLAGLGPQAVVRAQTAVAQVRDLPTYVDVRSLSM
jgi:hypothetical protein